MRTQIEPLLDRFGRVTTRRRLLTVLTRNEFDDEVRRGRLVAVFPRAYARPWDAEDPRLLERAALTSVGGPAALSHLSAVRRQGVAIDDRQVHLIVPATRHPQSIPGRLRIHRIRGRFPRCLWIDGLPTVELAVALSTSWPLLDAAEGRRAVIEATRRRFVSPAQLRDALAGCRGVRELRALIELLAAGCESELEIWGLTRVFNTAELAHGVRQLVVRVAGRTYRLDLAFEAEQVAVELDGFVAHGTRAQRERDLARDAALASIGWITVRFSYARLTNDPDGCRRELLAVLASRRSWRRSG